MHRPVVRLTVAIVALSLLSIAAQTSSPPRRTLRVVLYPFVPDKIGLFWLVEQSFERRHPDVDLQILDLSDNYYDQDSPHAVTNTEADVLEVDSVFMQDLIDSREIQPIPAQLRASTGSMLRVAVDAVTSGSAWFGIPHWVCTNFLFSRPQDALNAAATLDDVVNAIGTNHPPGRGLLIDLEGRLTLASSISMRCSTTRRCRAPRHLSPSPIETREWSPPSRKFVSSATASCAGTTTITTGSGSMRGSSRAGRAERWLDIPNGCITWTTRFRTRAGRASARDWIESPWYRFHCRRMALSRLRGSIHSRWRVIVRGSACSMPKRSFAKPRASRRSERNSRLDGESRRGI
jgi:hypothetical protein